MSALSFFIILVVFSIVVALGYEFVSRAIHMRASNKATFADIRKRLQLIRTRVLEDRNKINLCLEILSETPSNKPIYHLKKFEIEFRSMIHGNQETMNTLDVLFSDLVEEAECPINRKLFKQGVLNNRLAELGAEVCTVKSVYSKLHLRVRYHYINLSS